MKKSYAEFLLGISLITIVSFILIVVLHVDLPLPMVVFMGIFLYAVAVGVVNYWYRCKEKKT